MLPALDGLEVGGQIRRESQVPIVIFPALTRRCARPGSPVARKRVRRKVADHDPTIGVPSLTARASRPSVARP
jgi:hypothetical protein